MGNCMSNNSGEEAETFNALTKDNYDIDIEEQVSALDSTNLEERRDALKQLTSNLQQNPKHGVQYVELGILPKIEKLLDSKDKHESLYSLKAVKLLSVNPKTLPDVAKTRIINYLSRNVMSRSANVQATVAQILQAYCIPELESPMLTERDLFSRILEVVRTETIQSVQAPYSELLVKMSQLEQGPGVLGTRAHVSSLLAIATSSSIDNPRVKEDTAESAYLLAAGNEDGLSCLRQPGTTKHLLQQAPNVPAHAQVYLLKCVQLAEQTGTQDNPSNAEGVLQKGDSEIGLQLVYLLPLKQADVDASGRPHWQVWTQTCGLINEKCQNDEGVLQQVQKEGCVRCLLRCLQPKNPECRAGACDVLDTITNTDAAAQNVVSYGTIGALMNVLAQDPPTLPDSEKAAKLLRKFTKGNRTTCKSLSSSNISPLINVLKKKSPEYSGARHQALCVLVQVIDATDTETSSSTTQSAEQQKVALDICENGGVPALSDIISKGLDEGSKEGQQWASWSASIMLFLLDNKLCQPFVLDGMNKTATKQPKETLVAQAQSALNDIAAVRDVDFI